MQVKLISYSTPVKGAVPDLPEEMGALGLVAYCAKVSNPAKQHEMDSAPKLINYLTKNAHWSPFEMVSACFEIITTRDIARQILRHRSFSFQEFSQRYADVRALGESYAPRAARMQDKKNRQNSIATDDARLAERWVEMQDHSYGAALDAYEWAIKNGIAKEQARAVLPEGNTLSKLYMHGTLRSWIHYVQLRSGNGTQKEHQQIAIEIGEVLSDVFNVDFTQLDS